MNLETTVRNLEKNQIDVTVVDTKADALQLVKELLQNGGSVATGGSKTLEECGITDYLKQADHLKLLRRDNPKLTEQERADADWLAYRADYFLLSANAVTEQGELFNVDGHGNRVSNLICGAKQVIAVVGINKLVKDLDEAAYRLKTVAAPLNTKRLNKNTPCAKTGQCIALSENRSGWTAGCNSPERICCSYVVTAYQRTKRVRVIFVKESLGY